MFSSREKKRDANEHRKARRRAVTLQSHHRATLAGLFESLKNVVCPTTQKTPAKWKILDHAKGFLLEKEAYLSKLLALKEVVLNDNEGPKTLEEVREEYRKLYSKCYRAHVPHVDEGSDSSEDNEEMDESPQSTGLSVPNFQEFEGYLCFYRQTLELLLHSRVLASYQTSLPVVSQAISGLWNILPPEQKTAVQRHTLDEGSVPRARPADKPSFSPVDSSQLASVNTYGTSAFEAVSSDGANFCFSIISHFLTVSDFSCLVTSNTPSSSFHQQNSFPQLIFFFTPGAQISFSRIKFRNMCTAEPATQAGSFLQGHIPYESCLSLSGRPRGEILYHTTAQGCAPDEA
uniref:STRA8 bHLH domain-containing protein n=1 Tax=Electrophorus electricus TaxID=8005 RepID=A0A4W4H6G5_ELEEL